MRDHTENSDINYLQGHHYPAVPLVCEIKFKEFEIRRERRFPQHFSEEISNRRMDHDFHAIIRMQIKGKYVRMKALALGKILIIGEPERALLHSRLFILKLIACIRSPD